MSARKARALRRLDDRTMPMNVYAINRGMFEPAVNTPLDDAIKHLDIDRLIEAKGELEAAEPNPGPYIGLDFSERGVEIATLDKNHSLTPEQVATRLQLSKP